jgi:hypothetical protein
VKWGLYSLAISLGVLSVNYFIDIFHSRFAELVTIPGPNFTVAPGYEYAYSLGTCVIGFVNLFAAGGPNESFCDYLLVGHILFVDFLFRGLTPVHRAEVDLASIQHVSLMQDILVVIV